MIASAPRRHPIFVGQRRRRFVILTTAIALLAGCGGEKKVAAGNDVEMRDMEVVDGTINDSMTDLDAVQSDGVGLANEMGGGAASPASARPAPDRPINAAEPVSPE